MLYIQLNVPYHSYTFDCTEYLLHLIIRENATIYVNILQESGVYFSNNLIYMVV
jgi:hypothetical protein